MSALGVLVWFPAALVVRIVPNCKIEQINIFINMGFIVHDINLLF